MRNIELLAPARDFETGVAAINCGADAVYIGAARFGARESAGNDLTNLQQLIQYAHRYWAKVYVTVNTLLFDTELEEAHQLIVSLYQLGADALIIQDLGLLEMDLPPIPLFASTQMHNHTPERVEFLEKVGIQRVILARELSLQQIQEIRQKTSLELETFIHGSLCVSFSGQCSMSFTLGGRSGNRGQCAQPCRKVYSLEDGNGKTIIKNRHLLSIKDLNLSDHLEDLIDAGICSFKIEGRLKDKTYVTNVVSHYRDILDRILPAKNLRPASSGTSIRRFSPDPIKTFNRGFTTYFLLGRGEPIGAFQTPKSIGEPLGLVLNTSKNSFRLQSAATPIHPGDGVCFFDRNGELGGTVINQVIGKDIFPNKMDGIYPGISVFRNHDHQFLSILEKTPVERKIRLKFWFAYSENLIQLTAIDEDQQAAHHELAGSFAPAKNPALVIDMIKRQLSKLGGTEFLCEEIEITPGLPVFLTAAQINQIRRTVIDKLEQVRLAARPVRSITIHPTYHAYPEKKLSFRGNVLNHLAEKFYRRHGVEEVEPAAESGLNLRGRPIMTTKFCLRHEMGACIKDTNHHSHLLEPLTLVDEQGNCFPLDFDCKTCVMNVYLGICPE